MRSSRSRLARAPGRWPGCTSADELSHAKEDSYWVYALAQTRRIRLRERKVATAGPATDSFAESIWGRLSGVPVRGARFVCRARIRGFGTAEVARPGCNPRE